MSETDPADSSAGSAVAAAVESAKAWRSPSARDAAARHSAPRDPVAPEPLITPPPVAPVEEHERPWSESTDARCQHCGTAMGPEEIFCSECGAVSPLAARSFSQPRDTVVIERIVPGTPASATPAPSRAAPPSTPRPAARSTPVRPEPPLTVPDLPAFLREEPARPAPPVRQPRPTAPAAAADSASDIEDLEATRIVRPKRLGGERFVLQFSTGESSIVQGSGLIGRNPIPEPGEYFDQLVRVIDPSRSVSKTHLEFGQEAGSFWVLDRFSGNGTVVREPDAAVQRCQPGKRYRVVRGTRVEVGEQFFIVS